MESAYEPKKYEAEIYQRWEASGFFNPDKLPGKRKKKYSIVIPPPNITGSLHLGHVLNNTIQDIMIRFYRMNGYKTLWLPGTDHAGIATQNVVEKDLAKQGITRQQLGREQFVAKVWQWKEKYGNLIINQLKKLGCSCDWSRLRFTMDEQYIRAVQTAFIHYYNKGYIYRGPRVVNWCPRCHTSLSDLELEYKEETTKLYWLKYGPFVLATTRPETKLGDTAVAVNPSDSRYKNMVGKKYTIPGVAGDFEIVVVADQAVDPNFGTGAVKVTPAHDMTDYEISLRHKLPIKQVIDENGRMMANTGKYAGMTTARAREAIVQDMQRLGLIDHIDDKYVHNAARCYRCGSVIEPIPSTQWFLKMDKLVRPAYEAVESHQVTIIPERYQKVYLDWLSNIRDWCISRQLWWGHRLPVWFCIKCDSKNTNARELHEKKFGSFGCDSPRLFNGATYRMIGSSISSRLSDEKFVVSIEKPKECPFCSQCGMKQSEDVLDTWFSSALWPFATLGWPASAKATAGKADKSKDLKDYYPTNFLSTARDILYLWVARMIFSGLEFVKDIPFKDVYIHSTILNFEGRRMSKSLGTGIDPLGLIEQYGTDAMRLGLLTQINRDQQAIRFDERTALASRNFVNKLWNMSRFTQIQNAKVKSQNDKLKFKIKTLSIADKWILSRLNTIIVSITKKIKNYEFGEAARELYDFTWHELADWYIEISKIKNQKAKKMQLPYFIIP